MITAYTCIRGRREVFPLLMLLSAAQLVSFLNFLLAWPWQETNPIKREVREQRATVHAAVQGLTITALLILILIFSRC